MDEYPRDEERYEAAEYFLSWVIREALLGDYQVLSRRKVVWQGALTDYLDKRRRQFPGIEFEFGKVLPKCNIHDRLKRLRAHRFE